MRALLTFVLIVGTSLAQVQNAADVRAGVSTSVLAQGSLAVLNFSQPTSTPVASATVSILPATSTSPIPAQVVSVAPFVITFVVPATVPSGDAQLIYKPGNLTTQWTGITIVPANFSLYRTGSIGPLIAQNIAGNGTVLLNGLATPAQPGQAVTLWGTGLGSTPASAIQVTLGGVAQTVLYAGAAPGQPGLNQINFQIVPGTPDGCYVPLTVKYGAQTVTSFLSKTSDGQPCHHPFQLSPDVLTLLDSGAAIQAASVALSTAITAASSDRASRQESAQVSPQFLSAATLASYFVTGNPSQQCGIPVSNGSFSAILGLVPTQTSFGALTLQNGTSSLALPLTNAPTVDSPLNNLPPPGIAGGKWTLSAPSTATMSALSLNFALPPPVQLSAGAPISIDRSQNQTVTWNGSSFDSTTMLQLSLTGLYPTAPVLTCSVPAQAGALTLPANLLGQYGGGSAGAVSVSVTETGSGIPHAQYSLNGSPGVVLIDWTSTDARPVDFQ